MRIKKLVWEDDPVLGNLSLDFTDSAGTSYSTIILAGENGCGKTTVLNDIACIFAEDTALENKNLKTVDWESKDVGEIDVEASTLLTNENKENAFNSCVYSEARSGFETATLEAIVAKSNGTEEYEKRGSDYSCFVKLLMDLEEMDKNDWWDLSKNGDSTTYEQFMNTCSRISRFKKAFEQIFDSLEYVGKRQGVNNIYFKKNGQEIPIDQLSTGEKQIVFRGIDLLYHYKEDTIVLIDEPELSLHPMWQTKILPFYRSLFINQDDRQIAQLIIATHSEYVIQSGVDDSNNVKIIILSEENGSIKANKIDDALLENCNSEINYLAFGVDEVGYHIQLFAALHNCAQQTIKGVGPGIASIDKAIKKMPEYDMSIHEKPTSYQHPKSKKPTNYFTLPVYIRNSLDHPDNMTAPTYGEIKVSIELLRKIYKRIK